MRIAIFLMTALLASSWLSLVLGAVYTRSDAAGDALASAYAMIATVPVLLLALPAFLLAILDKALVLGLALAGLGMFLLTLAFAML